MSHEVYDEDLYFSIDPVSRVITNHSSDKTTLIQGDHASERFTFAIPHIIEGHDMSLCNKVQIHYINIGSNGERNSDVYTVTDLRIDPEEPDSVICTWLVSQNATKYAGSLNFLVRYACMTGSKLDYAWHSAVYSGIAVSNGINNSEEVVETYSDTLEQWYLELINAGNMGVNIVAEATDEGLNRIGSAVDEYLQENLSPKIDNMVSEAAKEVSEETFKEAVFDVVEEDYVKKVGTDHVEIRKVDPEIILRDKDEYAEDYYYTVRIGASHHDLYGYPIAQITLDDAWLKDDYVSLQISPGDYNSDSNTFDPEVLFKYRMGGTYSQKKLIGLSDIPIAGATVPGLIRSGGDIIVIAETGEVLINHAGHAGNATNDANGDVIHETYATKDALDATKYEISSDYLKKNEAIVPTSILFRSDNETIKCGGEVRRAYADTPEGCGMNLVSVGDYTDPNTEKAAIKVFHSESKQDKDRLSLCLTREKEQGDGTKQRVENWYRIYGEHYFPAATSNGMGGVKSGGDVTVEEAGTVKVNNAAKATSDANGNVIHETYAKKSDIPEVAEKAEYADVAGTVNSVPIASHTAVGGIKIPSATYTGTKVGDLVLRSDNYVDVINASNADMAQVLNSTSNTYSHDTIYGKFIDELGLEYGTLYVVTAIVPAKLSGAGPGTTEYDVNNYLTDILYIPAYNSQFNIAKSVCGNITLTSSPSTDDFRMAISELSTEWNSAYSFRFKRIY